MGNSERPSQTWDDSTPIGKMGLNARAYNALRAEGLDTLGKIADKTVRELLAIQALGAGSVGNIINCAEQLDLAGRVALLEEQVRGLVSELVAGEGVVAAGPLGNIISQGEPDR